MTRKYVIWVIVACGLFLFGSGIVVYLLIGEGNFVFPHHSRYESLIVISIILIGLSILMMTGVFVSWRASERRRELQELDRYKMDEPRLINVLTKIQEKYDQMTKLEDQHIARITRDVTGQFRGDLGKMIVILFITGGALIYGLSEFLITSSFNHHVKSKEFKRNVSDSIGKIIDAQIQNLRDTGYIVRLISSREDEHDTKDYIRHINELESKVSSSRAPDDLDLLLGVLYTKFVHEDNMAYLSTSVLEDRNYQTNTEEKLVQEAIGHLERASRSEDLFVKHRANSILGRIYLNSRSFDKAVEYLEKAKAVNQKDPFTIQTLGHGYILTGQYLKAIQEFNDGLDLLNGSTSSFSADLHHDIAAAYSYTLNDANLSEKLKSFYSEKAFEHLESSLVLRDNYQYIFGKPKLSELVERLSDLNRHCLKNKVVRPEIHGKLSLLISRQQWLIKHAKSFMDVARRWNKSLEDWSVDEDEKQNVLNEWDDFRIRYKNYDIEFVRMEKGLSPMEKSTDAYKAYKDVKSKLQLLVDRIDNWKNEGYDFGNIVFSPLRERNEAEWKRLKNEYFYKQ